MIGVEVEAEGDLPEVEVGQGTDSAALLLFAGIRPGGLGAEGRGQTRGAVEPEEKDHRGTVRLVVEPVVAVELERDQESLGLGVHLHRHLEVS